MGARAEGRRVSEGMGGVVKEHERKVRLAMINADMDAAWEKLFGRPRFKLFDGAAVYFPTPPARAKPWPYVGARAMYVGDGNNVAKGALGHVRKILDNGRIETVFGAGDDECVLVCALASLRQW
jgi:hypothetical protein